MCRMVWPILDRKGLTARQRIDPAPIQAARQAQGKAARAAGCCAPRIQHPVAAIVYCCGMSIRYRWWLVFPALLAACTPGVQVDVRPPDDAAATPAAPTPVDSAIAPASASSVDLNGPFEPTPRLPSTSVVHDLPLTGPGYQINEETQVVDYFGQFELRSDVGSLTADGGEILKLRVRELDAVRALDRLSRTEVFKDATARGASKPVEAMRQVGTEPGATASALPVGIGRFLVRTALDLRDLALDINDAARDAMADEADEDADQTDEPSTGTRAQKAATSLTLRYIGYSKARREIARHVGADPYSTNPLLDERLDKLAWAAWSGNKLSSLGWGLVGGVAAQAIGYAREAYKLAWELPPEDLKRRNLGVLADLGIRGKPARDLIRRSDAFTLTEQTEFVELLRLPEFHDARISLFFLALKAEREVHARFLIDAMRLLHFENAAAPRASKVVVIGTSIALKRNDGTYVLALPVDYLSWTLEVAQFAWRDDLIGRRNLLLVTGTLSPLALDAFSAAGWQVRERVSLAPADWLPPGQQPGNTQLAPYPE